MQPTEVLSPFVPFDAVLNSTIGVGLNFVTDFYVSHINENKLLVEAGINVEELAGKGFEKLSKPTTPLGKKVYSYLENEMSPGYKGSYYSKQHRMRKFVRASSPEGVKWWQKPFQLFSSPEKRAREIGLNKASYALRNSEMVSPELRLGLNNAFKFRTLGTMAISVGIAQLGFSVTEATLGGLASAGRRTKTINREGIVNKGFMDSRMAYTSRQRGLRAIQMAQSGFKRALGNEASYIKTVR